MKLVECFFEFNEIISSLIIYVKLVFLFCIILLFIFVTIYTNLWKNVAKVLFIYYNSMYIEKYSNFVKCL